jgi:hypothetical protein
MLEWDQVFLLSFAGSIIIFCDLCAETRSHQVLQRLHSHFYSQFQQPRAKQLLMRFSSTAAFTFLFIIINLLPLAISDLNSDKQALLDFTAAVPHRRNLSWSRAAAVCKSWVGITCSPDGTRVIALRLPGVGFVGHIPPGTLGKLDALRILSLRSNLLYGNLSSDITSLRSTTSTSNTIISLVRFLPPFPFNSMY